MRVSFEQVCEWRQGRHSQHPAPSAANELSGHTNQAAAKPLDTPFGRRQHRDRRGDESSKQVVRQELEEKRGVIRLEAPARNVAEAPAALPLRDESLDPRTVLVAPHHRRAASPWSS